MFDQGELDNSIKYAGNIAIYGGGIVAFNIKTALEKLYEVRIEDFYVTDVKEKEHFFGGIMPKRFSESNIEDHTLILVATPNEYHKDIEAELRGKNHNNYILIDQDIEYYLMGKYLRQEIHIILVEDVSENSKNKAKKNTGAIEVYMAKSIYDKQLAGQYRLPSYVIEVQAGKALTERQILSVTDDTGSHISERNRNYSELTVTYWAWKNRKAEYKGICHYRRMFQLTQTQLEELFAAGADVILPLPFVCEPDASEQYFRYIRKEDFRIFLKIVEETVPERAGEIKEILMGRYLYNYNMLIARQTVFDAYCAFMFEILEQMDKYFTRRGILRNDRYLGYFGELLTSVYFIMNSRKLHIVHAEKHLMI